MLSFLAKKLFNKQIKQSTVQLRSGDQPPIPLRPDLLDNLAMIKLTLDNPQDLIARQFQIGSSQHRCAIVCIEGLIDKMLVNEQILKSALIHLPDFVPTGQGLDVLNYLQDQVLPIQDIARAKTLDDLLVAVLSGDTAILVDGTNEVLLVDSKGWKTRQIEEPKSEAVIRGPREGFTEDLRTNLAMIRRKVIDPNLRIESFRFGRRSRRQVMILYIQGVVNTQLVKEVKRRIQSIDVDDPSCSLFIEQWVSDSILSPFPQLISTERPDKIASMLLQGRVALLVDGTPFQLTLPVTLATCFQSPEDYYQSWIIATLVRILRLISAFLATFLPALYIALVEYHHGLIPSKLAFSIAGSREGVPFPAVVEAFIMEFTLEVLREAGVRLPKPIGQTIGIVGGLVIGEAAVSAGIVSPIMVIVVAITAISSFALPSYMFAFSLRMIRFAIMLAAAIFGLYGIVLAYIMINIHLVNLSSFGVPYSAPFAPQFTKDWKDLIFRAPVTQMDKRPFMLRPEDENRMNK